MARFREQPQICSGACCGNVRRWEKGAKGLTVQEQRMLFSASEFDIRCAALGATRS